MAELRKLKVTEMNRLTVEEFKEARKLPLVVVLDVQCFVHRTHSWLIAFTYAASPLLLLIRKCTRRHWEPNIR